ncbi:hypothetical protein [Listeria booriae]|uniref:Uncharacterized protein n=1 Tax=Listeria booriae TaxID=1552123 RepID=A0A841ZVQ2_9LIST|nr:hypothetical protein [Listeria booriae]MBC1564132.1 hypothetical protein [Listeria booriae]
MDELKTEAQALYAANILIYDAAMKLLDIKASSREDVIKAAKLMQGHAAKLTNIDADLCEIELADFQREFNVPIFGQRSGEK